MIIIKGPFALENRDRERDRATEQGREMTRGIISPLKVDGQHTEQRTLSHSLHSVKCSRSAFWREGECFFL